MAVVGHDFPSRLPPFKKFDGGLKPALNEPDHSLPDSLMLYETPVVFDDVEVADSTTFSVAYEIEYEDTEGWPELLNVVVVGKLEV